MYTYPELDDFATINTIVHSFEVTVRASYEAVQVPGPIGKLVANLP